MFAGKHAGEHGNAPNGLIVRVGHMVRRVASNFDPVNPNFDNLAKILPVHSLDKANVFETLLPARQNGFRNSLKYNNTQNRFPQTEPAMHPLYLFRHCPRCGAGPFEPGANPLVCAACGFAFFFNPTVSAAAFVFDDRDRALFIRRAKEPAKGKLAIPGGFIDIGETAEFALMREVREEVGIDVVGLSYLGSCTNDYFYRGVTYPVVDLVFRATALNPDTAEALDGVAGFEWRRLLDIDPAELAFPSLKMGWRKLTE